MRAHTQQQLKENTHERECVHVCMFYKFPGNDFLSGTFSNGGSRGAMQLFKRLF